MNKIRGLFIAWVLSIGLSSACYSAERYEIPTPEHYWVNGFDLGYDWVVVEAEIDEDSHGAVFVGFKILDIIKDLWPIKKWSKLDHKAKLARAFSIRPGTEKYLLAANDPIGAVADDAIVEGERIEMRASAIANQNTMAEQHVESLTTMDKEDNPAINRAGTQLGFNLPTTATAVGAGLVGAYVGSKYAGDKDDKRTRNNTSGDGVEIRDSPNVKVVFVSGSLESGSE